jgi:FAD/FMN-containing dehydrogenase
VLAAVVDDVTPSDRSSAARCTLSPPRRRAYPAAAGMGGLETLVGLDGSVTRRGDHNYEPTRRSMLWNGWKPSRFPELIVRAASERDVVAAVTFARSRGLKVAVRAGGHSWCGSPLREGGMLLDLSRLREVAIDPMSRTAKIQPGVTSRELASALAEHELAFPVGHSGHVGLSGFLLSGGFGWNEGICGPACLSVTGIDAVTADGQLTPADEDRNAELFWAARGAGPGLCAVVTRFHLKAYPLPKAITSSTYVFPIEDAGDVACWAGQVRPALPPTVELALLLVPAPPDVPSQPGERVALLAGTAFVDSGDEASRALALLEECPARHRCLSRAVNQATSFEKLFEAEDAAWPEGHRFAADNVWLDGDPGEVVPELATQIVDAPSAKSLVLVAMPPAPSKDAPQPDMAFSMLGRARVYCYSVWEDEADDDANIGWLRTAMEALTPLAVGHYVAETDLLADPSRSARSFSPTAWERLTTTREGLDPQSLFHGYLGLD